MGQLAEEIRQEQLAWAHRRLAALGPKWGQALRFAIWHRLAVIVIFISIAKTKLKKVKKEKWQYNAKIVQFYSNIL